MASAPGPWTPTTVVNQKQATSTYSGGTTVGGGDSGGGGGRSPVLAVTDVESIETAVSAEVSVAVSNPTSNALQIAWNGFPGADGYRVFVYEKDASGKIINSRYRDVGKEALSLSWQFDEGVVVGEPTFQNDFRTTAIVDCERLNAGTMLIGDYVEDLLKYRGGKVDADLDLASFAEIDSEVGEEVSRYIDSQTTVGQLISEIEIAVMGYLKPNDDGTLGLYLIDPTKEPVLEIKTADILHPKDGGYPVKTRFNRQNTINKVIGSHDFDPITGAFETEEVTIDEATIKWVENDSFELSSVLVGESANKRMALMYAAYLKQQQTQILLPVRSSGFVVGVGDVVSVTKERGFKPSGAYEGERFIAFDYARNLEKATVDLVGIQPFRDMDKVRVVAPETGSADWATATDEEKETFAYVADENGLVDTEYGQAVVGLR